MRTKSNVLLQRRYSHPVDKSTGVRSDQTVILTSFESASVYPDALRRVSYFDAETNKRLKFLTNNFVLPPLTIAQIYKCRWQVELFFKWIKQHLRIKAFYGTSENAVKTQIWIAVSVYVLVAIIRKRLGLEASRGRQNGPDRAPGACFKSPNQGEKGRRRISLRTMRPRKLKYPICVLQGFGCFLGAGNGFHYRLALSFECVEQLRELF